MSEHQLYTKRQFSKYFFHQKRSLKLEFAKQLLLLLYKHQQTPLPPFPFSFQIKVLFKKAQFDVDWSHRDDVNLLKGVFDCGMGNWEAIKADSTYDLQDKVRAGSFIYLVLFCLEFVNQQSSFFRCYFINLLCKIFLNHQNKAL